MGKLRSSNVRGVVAPLPLPVTEPWPVEEGQQLHVVSSSSTSWTVSVVETSASGIVKCRCSAGALPSDAPGGAVFSEQWEWVGLLTGTAGDGTLEAVTIKSLVQRLRKRDQWQEASGSSGAGMALLAEKSSGADGPASHPQVVSTSIVAMLIMFSSMTMMRPGLFLQREEPGSEPGNSLVRPDGNACARS